MTTTDRDMHAQVMEALDDYGSDFDTRAIVRDLIERFGRVDVDSTPPDAFWRIVRAREVQKRPVTCTDCGLPHADPDTCAAAGAGLVLGVRP